VHYPSCSGGAGQYQCEDAATSSATLCDNYPSYSESADKTSLECVCPSQPANNCAGQACTTSQICVHYPSCSGGAGQYQCEDAATSPAGLCGNYPSYSESADKTSLECVCQ
jgi:hypothetical protein